jgi:hypothetical protein
MPLAHCITSYLVDVGNDVEMGASLRPSSSRWLLPAGIKVDDWH